MTRTVRGKDLQREREKDSGEMDLSASPLSLPPSLRTSQSGSFLESSSNDAPGCTQAHRWTRTQERTHSAMS